MQLDFVPYSESSNPPRSADCTAKSCAIVNMWGKNLVFIYSQKEFLLDYFPREIYGRYFDGLTALL